MLNLIKFTQYSFLIILLNCRFLVDSAQHYPVMVSTIIIPPYSARISDYAESGSDRVQVVINPLDMSLESYKVKIKLIIESLDGRIRMETDPTYLPPPIYLNGGIPEILTGFDLEGLFDANHLLFQKGLSKNEYLIRKKLPENYYRIGFVLLDYNRATLGGKTNEVVISNLGSSLLGIFLNDPPLLNLPANYSKLRLSEPQQIVLQWTPRHRGSPNSAFTAEYVVRLYEVWNENYSAAAITQTQMPIFETTTSDNRIIYGPSDPMLIPGNKYVWTVQARESEGRDMFRNEGISESFMFTWGEACKTPESFKAIAVNGPGIELKWNTSIGHTDYDIQYKPLGTQNWYEENSLLSSLRILKLTYNSTYETRIRANCGSYSSEFSAPVILRTPEAPVQTFSCGTAGVIPQVSSITPLFSLPSGAIFYAGGFECHVIESATENGTFSGTCYVVIPYYGFAKVLHTFKNIRVNSDLQMFSGRLISVTDTVKGTSLATRVDDALRPVGTGFNNEQLEQLLDADRIVMVDGRIKMITVSDNGQVLVTFQNGDTETLEYEEGEKLVVSDKDGEQYVVDNGTVITGSDALTSKASEVTTMQRVDNTVSARELLPLVHFAPAVSMQYGFDSLQYPALKGQYNTNNILGKEYILPFKAVATGGIDEVEAMMPTGNGFKIDGLGFRINQTITVARASEQGNARTVQVASLLKEDNQVLEAVYSMKDDSGRVVEETLGQINIVAYDKQIINLVIVPVGSQDDYKHFEIDDLINRIYSQSVIQCNIQWEEPFECQTWDINGDKIFDDTDNDNRMDYTPAMKELIQTYNDQRETEKQTVYVFLFNGEHASKDLKGFMPLNKQFGFIFTNNTTAPGNLAHDISHEIAHGAFNLRHTFSDENPYYQPMGTTGNLMDYGSGDAITLNKYQWDLIHDPERVWFGWLEEEGEGAISLPCMGWFDDCDDVLKILETFRNARIDGKQVKIRKETKTDERTLVASSVKIGGIDYDRIRLIYKPKNKDYTFNPVNYNNYDQQFFIADGSVDWQRGFIYNQGKEELFKILVDDEVSKISKLKEYLFGKELDEILQIFAENEFLTPIQIGEIREQISLIKDEEQRKELYIELQKKVPYHNQRNNDQDQYVSDRMCNLTSEAMCLEYLGISCPNENMQFEDYLEQIREDNNYGDRTTQEARQKIAQHLGACYDKKDYGSTFAIEKNKLKEFVSPKLQLGCAIMLSVWPGCKGHLVRVQEITDDGLIVDDPYGKVTDFNTREDCNSGGYDTNSKTDEYSKGSDNLWRWSDIKDITVKYVEIYCKCE